MDKLTPARIICGLAVIGFVLAGFGVKLGAFSLTDISLAFFAASFIV